MEADDVLVLRTAFKIENDQTESIVSNDPNVMNTTHSTNCNDQNKFYQNIEENMYLVQKEYNGADINPTANGICYNETSDDHSLNELDNEKNTTKLGICDNHVVSNTNSSQAPESNNGSKKQHICSTCNKEFTRKYNLQMHMRIHTGEKRYVCTYNDCGDQFTKREDLRKHKQIHFAEKPHVCNICHDRFAENSHLIAHQRVHTNNTIRNDYSQNKIADDKRVVTESYRSIEQTTFQTSVNRDGLVTTEQNLSVQDNASHAHEPINGTKGEHVCTTCNKTFTRNYNLQLHMRIHTGDKRYVCMCHACGKQFTRRADLRKHERIHTGEKPYVCKICDNRFTESSHLIAHEKIHTGEKPYVCGVCGKRFNRSCNFRRHEKKHEFSWRLYWCRICYKSFQGAAELRLHEREHMGGKPYMCGVCNEAFDDIGSIHEHQKLHGEVGKEYICGICGKDFYACHKLLAHLRHHTGEKPFYCRICGKGFTKKRHWVKHELVKHKTEKLIPNITTQTENSTVPTNDSS